MASDDAPADAIAVHRAYYVVHDPCDIHTVLLADNGQMAVFCQHGVRMPAYQQHADVAIPKLRRDAPADTVWEDWRTHR